MNIEWNGFGALSDYDNILVVDEKGDTLFYDIPDLNVLRQLSQRPEDFLGKNITDFYTDLTYENSTMMNVLKNRIALCNVKQEMTTNKGNAIVSIQKEKKILRLSLTILMIVYCGEKQAEYLFGHTTSIVAHHIYIGAILWGLVGSLLLVWSLLDIMLALIVVPNMVALILLSGKVKDITTNYFHNHYRKTVNKDTTSERKDL